MANPFVHAELRASDLSKAREFYGNLFDWGLEEVSMGDRTYIMIRVGEGAGGGMMGNPMPGSSPHWLPYVEVDDIAKATKEAETLGGTVAQQPTEMASGSFSVIVDPDGAALGLWQRQARG